MAFLCLRQEFSFCLGPHIVVGGRLVQGLSLLRPCSRPSENKGTPVSIESPPALCSPKPGVRELSPFPGSPLTAEPFRKDGTLPMGLGCEQWDPSRLAPAPPTFVGIKEICLKSICNNFYSSL